MPTHMYIYTSPLNTNTHSAYTHTLYTYTPTHNTSTLHTRTHTTYTLALQATTTMIMVTATMATTSMTITTMGTTMATTVPLVYASTAKGLLVLLCSAVPREAKVKGVVSVLSAGRDIASIHYSITKFSHTHIDTPHTHTQQGTQIYNNCCIKDLSKMHIRKGLVHATQAPQRLLYAEASLQCVKNCHAPYWTWGGGQAHCIVFSNSRYIIHAKKLIHND